MPFVDICERSFGECSGRRSPKEQQKMKNTIYSVKKHQSYWVLIFALLLCGSVQAKVNHYVGVSAQIGEWSLIPTQSKYAGSVGVAGGAGFQYELQAGKKYSSARFLMDLGVGATGGMTAYMQSSSMFTKLEGQYDLQNELFDYNYEIQDRQDKYNNIAVQVPILFGVQYKRFYALAGVKVYANIWTKTSSTATVNTFGDYTGLGYGIFRDMPEYQFFTDKKVSGGVKTSLNLDLDLSFEIGARLGTILYDVGYDVPKRKIEYRLAAFFDYGLIDVHTKGTKEMLEKPAVYDTNPESPDYIYNPDGTNESMVRADRLVMNDIMSTNGFASFVNNMMVGVKFTILFQMPEPGQCVICRDNYVSSARSYTGGRRGMKYEE